LFAVVLFAGTWVGARAWFAKGDLEQAQSLVTALKDRVSGGDYSGVVDTYGQIQQHTVKARGLTQDPLWSVAEHVPVLGPNLKALRELTAVVDDAMTAGEPLASLATDLTPAALAPHDGKIPLEPFIKAASMVPTAATDFTAIQTRLAAVPTAGTVHQLQDAKSMLTGVIDSAAKALSDAAPIVREVPAFLGADGPRTYVVMFLNNAELRALGGTALSFAEITVDQGAIKLGGVVPASGGTFKSHKEPIIPLPDGTGAIYPYTLGYFIANATIRPSAVTAAQIVQAEWKSTFGTKVDGVISMDGGALAYLLKAVGPVTISTGDVVTSKNVESLLLNEVYQRYDTGNYAVDNAQQGVVYSETVSATFAKLTSGGFDPLTLFDALQGAADTHRMSVWFANPKEQATIATTPFAAKGLPESTATTDVVGVYLKNQSWSKLDYYLASTLTTGTAVCTPDGRQVHRVTLSLTNTLAPADVPGLSPSIAGGYKLLGLAKGVQQYIVYVYLPKGATLLSASVQGEPIAATDLNDTGHPVQIIRISVPPGSTNELSVDILMGRPGNQTLRTDITPTVRGTKRVSEPLDCSSVALP
jgi:hypothetical protein